MPLLDAALAFALTMLALSSLAGLILNWLHSLAGYRKQQLAKMLEALFVEEVIPEAERQLTTAVGDEAAELRKQVKEAEEKLEAEAEARPDDALTPRQLAWLKVLGGSGVLQAIEDQSLTSLAWDELKEKLRANRRAQEVADSLEQEVEIMIDRLAGTWERIGDRFTESFRAHARTWSVIVSMGLAFGLNIDAFYLLNAYMTDDSAAEAVIAQQGTTLGQARPFAGTAAPTAASEDTSTEGSEDTSAEAAGGAPDFGAIQQQATALRSDNLAIGWDLFPYCPPTSEDERCIEYWQGVVGGFDISVLGFEQREALSPARRACVAVFGFLGTCDGKEGAGGTQAPQPALVSHTATDGGPAGGDRARGAGAASVGAGASDEAPEWPAGALLFWVLGCGLTGVLAGQGSPFWYEVVSRLGRLRDDLRKARVQKEKKKETTGQNAPEP